MDMDNKEYKEFIEDIERARLEDQMHKEDHMIIKDATPAKLRNGCWGARVQDENITAGDVVTVTTKNGKSWKSVIVKVLWRGEGVSLCSTRSLDRD
jgi:hypothetical protein